MVEVQKVVNKVIFEKRRTLEDEIKGLDVKIGEGCDWERALGEWWKTYEGKIKNRCHKIN